VKAPAAQLGNKPVASYLVIHSGNRAPHHAVHRGARREHLGDPGFRAQMARGGGRRGTLSHSPILARQGQLAVNATQAGATKGWLISAKTGSASARAAWASSAG